MLLVWNLTWSILSTNPEIQKYFLHSCGSLWRLAISSTRPSSPGSRRRKTEETHYLAQFKITSITSDHSLLATTGSKAPHFLQGGLENKQAAHRDLMSTFCCPCIDWAKIHLERQANKMWLIFKESIWSSHLIKFSYSPCKSNRKFKQQVLMYS